VAYVLLETPYGVPTSFEETTFALQVRGYTSLISHPTGTGQAERCRALAARLAVGWNRGYTPLADSAAAARAADVVVCRYDRASPAASSPSRGVSAR
jgi:hypothetical protein